MKSLLYFLSIFFFIGCASNKQMSVMSFNIRFDNPKDSINNWKYRKPIIKTYLDSVKPDIIGTQEAMDNQIADLKQMLPHYTYIGYGLDQGQRWGEQCHIFFKSKEFELKKHSQFRLADNPDIAGDMGWDAALHRTVVWVELLHKKSGITVFFFNTHMDHVGKQAKRESAKVIARKVKEIAGNNPFVITGDFNTSKNSDIYTSTASIFKNEIGADDAGNKYSQPGVHTTFNGFKNSDRSWLIDYVFVSNNVEIESYKIDKIIENDVFISDHWPLLVKLRLK